MSRLYHIGDYDRLATNIQASDMLEPECQACGHYRNVNAHVIEDPCPCGCVTDSYVLEALSQYVEHRQRPLVPQANCGCMGHSMPGVRHIAACCDVPHVDQL